MQYTNLLGEVIDTDEARKKKNKTNPMVKAYGPGPDIYRCKHCSHIFVKSFSKNYYKCTFRGNTNGLGTDHKVNWPTCGKFKREIS